MRVLSTTLRRCAFSFLTVFLSLSLTASADAQWSVSDSITKSSLRGIYNSGGGVVWASGTNGVILRSQDAGRRWQAFSPPDSGQLDFRGVWAWDSQHAAALSSGAGEASRLYETKDGGAHWRLLFTNPDSAGFWDALAFSSTQKGMLLGDPVNGRFVIFTTNDGGHHWSRNESPALAADPPGESAFAASNSSLILSSDGSSAFFGTGGPGGFRIFHFRTGTNHLPDAWTCIRLPSSHHSDSAGIFSLAFRDDRHGVAIGGNYKQPNERENTAFLTADGGLTWTAAQNTPSGYRSAVAWHVHARAWIAVGPNGSDVSYDDGQTWTFFDKTGWNAISLPWVVGPNGLIAMLKEASLKSVGQSSLR